MNVTDKVVKIRHTIANQNSKPCGHQHYPIYTSISIYASNTCINNALTIVLSKTLSNPAANIKSRYVNKGIISDFSKFNSVRSGIF